MTRLESTTHSPSGAFALCDKSSKNVNKLSDSANLLYYLRTAPEKDLLCWQVFVSWQKSAQTEQRREIQIWRPIKWHGERKIQPWNNFCISSRCSLTHVLTPQTAQWCRKQLSITLIAAPARVQLAVRRTQERCLSFSRCPALVIRLASPEVNQSSRHGAKQSSDLRLKTDVSVGLPHRLAPVWGEPEIVFTAAEISSIQNGFITDGHRDTILHFFFGTANALFSRCSRTSIRLR